MKKVKNLPCPLAPTSLVTPLRLFHKFAKGLIDGSVQNSSMHLLSPIHANIRLEEFVPKMPRFYDTLNSLIRHKSDKTVEN